jgi:hypothetical protein
MLLGDAHLSHGEEKREVAVDAVLALKLLGGLDALPGAAELWTKSGARRRRRGKG